MMLPPDQIFSIEQISKSVKELLETAYASIAVRGELKEAKVAGANGHIYGKLTDGIHNLTIVVWRQTWQKMAVRPEEYVKQEVVVRGRISSYPTRNEVQLVVASIAPIGLGTKLLELEQLKQKLAAEGLFAAERKRALPAFPKNIAVITSGTGAAVHDIYAVWKKRYPMLDVWVFPAQVQGALAPASILKALSLVKENVKKLALDLLIIGRGGGASEDLNAFNDEKVVRTAAAMPIPLISAVGHQINSTLLDYVADVQATTPTDAAVKAVPDLTEVRRFLKISENRFNMSIELTLRREKETYSHFEVLLKESMRSLFTIKAQTLDSVADILAAQNPSDTLWQRRALYTEYANNLRQSAENMLTRKNEELNAQKLLLKSNLQAFLKARAIEVGGYERRLSDLSPQRVLERGYAIVLNKEGRHLSLKEAKVGEAMNILLEGGHIGATIDKIDMANCQNG